MMYAAGLTVREISEYCHAKRGSVQRHLQLREQYRPGLKAEHEQALADRAQDWATPAWRERFVEVQAFTTTHGRLPDLDVEASLYQWLANQRRSHGQGTLSPEHTALLATLGDWTVTRRQQTADEHWRERLSQLISFMTETGRTPRYKRHASEQERVLGVWLHAQTQACSQGNILPQRHAALDAAWPDWRSRE